MNYSSPTQKYANAWASFSAALWKNMFLILEICTFERHILVKILYSLIGVQVMQLHSYTPLCSFPPSVIPQNTIPLDHQKPNLKSTKNNLNI